MTLTGWSGYCCACAVTDASGNVRAKNANNRSIYVSSEPADDHLSKENITSASAAKRHGTARESVLPFYVAPSCRCRLGPREPSRTNFSDFQYFRFAKIYSARPLLLQ